jgi:hypothetical protein
MSFVESSAITSGITPAANPPLPGFAIRRSQ